MQRSKYKVSNKAQW